MKKHYEPPQLKVMRIECANIMVGSFRCTEKVSVSENDYDDECWE